MSLFPDLVKPAQPDEPPVPAPEPAGSGEPLDVTCPECGAKPKEKCRNYLGKACAPHGLRKDACQGPQADPFSVACPICGAKVGAWCKRPSGHSGGLVAPHAVRGKIAQELMREKVRDGHG